MNTYSTGEFSDLIGVSIKTLQRWDREGILVADRTPTNRRLYTDKHLIQMRVGLLQHDRRKTVVYCRVSSAAQKPDLHNQKTLLEQFCVGRGLAVDEWIEEIDGGMNFKRKKFIALTNEVLTGRVETVIVAHKDRLARFGFEYIEHIYQQFGCEVIVMNTESLSPQQEMVEDLMTIVHTFSDRLYGLRNYRKVLEKTLADDKSAQDTP